MLNSRGAAGALAVIAVGAVGWRAAAKDDAPSGPRAESVVRTTQPLAPTASTPRTTPTTKDVVAVKTKPAKRRTPATAATSTSRANAGDLVISGISGHVASARLLSRVRTGQVAGVILMGENIDTVAQVRALTASIRAAAAAGHQLPPLVMTDQEGGTVKRFRSAHPDRSARAMSRQPLTTVERSGRLTGADLLARGVNVDLAPVVDAPDSATNFLGTRAFSGDPTAVTRNACAFARGLSATGVVPTLKHFPGLGGAGALNTDLGPVTINQSLARLKRGWKPYAGCGDGTALTMISSAVYPALTGATAAVLSPKTYAALGRIASGPYITDALEGAALAHEPDVAARAVRAGVDLLLYTGERNAELGHDALAAAIRSGSIGHATIRERARRVRALRRMLSTG